MSFLSKIFSNENDEEFDEIWVIARRKDRLLKLQEEVNSKLRILPLDLTKKESFEEIEKMLKHTWRYIIAMGHNGKPARMDEVILHKVLYYLLYLFYRNQLLVKIEKVIF